MNTPQLQQIAVGDIFPTSDNQRKNIEKSEGFDELIASIKGGGVRQPVQVWPHPDKKGKYELRAGERRYRAAKAAGAEIITAIIYTGLSDAEAMDLTYIENKFRKDLKPMEEAAEVALLIERFGGDVRAIAGRIGKKERWVRLRANINAKLIKEWKSIFENLDKHPSFRSWSVKHLTLIARLPAARQKQLLVDATDYYFEPEECSAADLKEYIGKELKLLSGAKWELADETLLPKAGACSKCEKRSGHQPLLWFDSDEQVEAGDQCLDGHCYQAKEMALLQRTAAGLRAKHPELVYAASDHPNSNEARQISENLGGYISKWDYKTCPKSAKGALPAMYINGKGAGKLTYIKLSDTGSGRAGKAKGVPTPLKQRRAMLDAKRWAQLLIDLREKVAATKVTEICFDDKATGLMALVALYGNKISYHARADVKYKSAEELIKAGRKKVLETLWETFGPTLDDLLTYNGPITQTSKEYIIRAEWIAKLICIDVKAMLKEVSSRKGFAVPKSWAGLKEDGTPKKAKPIKKNKSEKKERAKRAKTKKAGKKDDVQSCRICGCTDTNPCIDKKTGEPCHWVEDDLCSSCEVMAVKK